MQITIPEVFNRIEGLENKINNNEDFNNFSQLLEITIPELFKRVDGMSNQINNLNNRISKLEN